MTRALPSTGIKRVGTGERVARSILVLGLALIATAGCSSSPTPQGVYKLGQPYQIQGRWYYPEYDPDYDRVGIASWYGAPFHGRSTANGEVFDRDNVTAAHPTLPLPSLVRVVNLNNQRELTVRVNDRGPFVGDRIIDLSQEAARQLGFERQGITPVRVQFIRLADARGTAPRPTIRHMAPLEPGSEVEAKAPVRVAVAQPSTQVAGAQVPMQAAVALVPTQVAVNKVAMQDRADDAARCRGEFIQVGAFAEPSRAQLVVAELHALQALPVRLSAPTEDRLARVRLGPISDPATASAALDRLKRFGFAGAFIVGPEKEFSMPC